MRRAPKSLVLASLLLIAALGAAGELPAQETAATPSPGIAPQGLEQGVAELNRTLKDLVRLLEMQVADQRLALLVQRVQLKQARLAPQEQELARLRNEREGLQEQLARVQIMKEEMEAQAAAEGEGDSEQQERFRQRIGADFERETGLLKDRQWRLEQQIIDLENKLDRERALLESWEAVVDEELGIR